MKKVLDKLLGAFLVALMASIVLAVLWQVFSRYVLQDPSSYTEEIARFLLIWIGLLGAAFASGQNEHLSINILPDKLKPQYRKTLMRLIDLLVITFCLMVLVIGGGNLVLVNAELGQESAALHMPLSIIYAVIPLSGLIVILYKLEEMITQKDKGL